jgi:hypothetical protein
MHVNLNCENIVIMYCDKFSLFILLHQQNKNISAATLSTTPKIKTWTESFSSDLITLQSAYCWTTNVILVKVVVNMYTINMNMNL